MQSRRARFTLFECKGKQTPRLGDDPYRTMLDK